LLNDSEDASEALKRTGMQDEMLSYMANPAHSMLLILKRNSANYSMNFISARKQKFR
jgi:hypothetical protein